MKMNSTTKILVVNDMVNNLVALEKKLQDTGAEIVKAKTDIEALAACLSQDFAMAVLDVRMLEMNDYALLKRLRRDRRTRRIPLVFLTGAPEKSVQELEKHKIRKIDYLQKPVDSKTLTTRAKGLIKFQEQNRKLEHVAREWKTALDGITDMVALFDSHNRILRCNRAMRDFLGVGYDRIRGRTCGDLIHQERDISRECPLARMKETGGKESVILPIGDRFYEEEIHPILDRDGKISGAVQVMRDITRKKNIEQEMAN